MNETFLRILHLVQSGDVKISDHGYDELAADNIFVRDVMATVADAVIVEDYPNYPKGLPYLCCRKIERDRQYMWYGAFQKGHYRRQSSLLLTVLTGSAGRMIS